MNGTFHWNKQPTAMSLDVSLEELCQLWVALNDYSQYYGTWNVIDEMLRDILEGMEGNRFIVSTFVEETLELETI
jgi:hypothetical protein